MRINETFYNFATERYEKGIQHSLLDDIACFVGTRLHIPCNMGPFVPDRFGILDSSILQMAVERKIRKWKQQCKIRVTGD